MGNLLKEFNGRQYQYDQRGNLVRKTDQTGVTSYEWNDLNQLTKLINHKGTTYYRYDTFGRRIYKQTPDGKETYSIWDGDMMVMEDSHNHIRHFIYEPGSFAPLAQVDTNAENNPTQVYFYHNDHLGTPELMSDESGELVWLGTKTAYGQMYEQTSALAKLNNVSNPIRFQGQYYDEESGLHYNRYRYYDPETGRYISEDLNKLAWGMNVYGYPRNPVHAVDPMGLNPGVLTVPSIGAGVGTACSTGVGCAAVAVGASAVGGYYIGTKINEATGASDYLADLMWTLSGNANAGSKTTTSVTTITMSTPGTPNCTPQQYEVLNKAVEEAKSVSESLGKCTSGMSNGELRKRHNAFLKEYQARSHRENKCWSGGDRGHQVQMADKIRAFNKCKEFMK